MKIGDIVSLDTIIIGKNKDKAKIISSTYQTEEKKEKKLFEIIGKVTPYNSWLVLVPEKYTGWFISKFHIEHCNVPEKYLGSKFFEITENHIT